MQIPIRTDASIQIGNGHVMRCLTLADALKKEGAECHFVCRRHEGTLLELIQQRGHKAHALPVVKEQISTSALDNKLDYQSWLGVDPCVDVKDSLHIHRKERNQINNVSYEKIEKT